MKDNNNSDAFVLSVAHSDFIQHHISINVASCDANNRPSIARALGCRLSSDRRRVTVFVPRDHSQKLLRDVAASGAVAVVFSRPSTHETLQLKGNDATITSAEQSDSDLVAKFLQEFVEELSAIGYTKEFSAAVLYMAKDESVAVTFSPSVAFVQTPGPSAGSRLPG